VGPKQARNINQSRATGTLKPNQCFAVTPLPAAAPSTIRMFLGELDDGIRNNLDQHAAGPKPFVWTRTASAILAEEHLVLEGPQSVTDGDN
jgi:hypothetical protein